MRRYIHARARREVDLINCIFMYQPTLLNREAGAAAPLRGATLYMWLLSRNPLGLPRDAESFLPSPPPSPFRLVLTLK